MANKDLRHIQRLALGLLVATAICFSGASPAAANAPREFWSGAGYYFCVNGVTSGEKTTLKQVDSNTDSEVANMGEGTWKVCWVDLSLNETIALRNAAQQLSPALPERWDSAFVSATSSIGQQTQGSYLPIVPSVTRLVTGNTWTVTAYDGYFEYSRTCSASSTSCSVNDVATLSVGYHTVTTTITGYAGSGSSISRSEEVFVFCD